MDLKLTQRLGQRLAMTPQLQQRIKILQLTRGELDTLIEEELRENPTVERVDKDELAFNGNETEAGAFDGGGENEKPSTKADEVDWQTQLAHYSDESDTFFPTRSYSAGEDSQNAPEDRYPRETESLVEHLTWQLRFLNLTETEEYLAYLIIGHLGVNGYLEASLEEIARIAKHCPEDVEKALALVQSCEPIGVGARNLQECLLLQLKVAPRKEEYSKDILRLAVRIVEDYFVTLKGSKQDALVKALRVDASAITSALKIIVSLEPKPGRQYGGGDIRYVTPDVHVRKIDETYVVTLNENGLPRLKVNHFHRRLLSTGDAKVREYIQKKLTSAKWLIDSIHERQRTLLKVSKSLVKFQKAFLNEGMSHLRPLGLRDVADDIGTHESTVSRAISNKYIDTPRGLYPLKKFFITGLKQQDGEELSPESIKAQIGALIADENPRKPLTDEALARRLANQNVRVARRTVAKYREALNISPSAKRKRPI